MSRINTETEPVDMTGSSVDGIVAYFFNRFNLSCFFNPKYAKSDFYCGITNSIQDNFSRHGINGYFACVNCASKEIAGKVEATLGEMGFDIGHPKNPVGNGGADDSTIVYIVYKESGFKR